MKNKIGFADEISKQDTEEEDSIMAALSKPTNRAFVLKADKVAQFMRKTDSSKKAMERFYKHQPKDGVITPLKGKNE